MTNDINLKALHISIVNAIKQFPKLEQAIIPNPQGHDLVIGIFERGHKPVEDRLICWFDSEPTIYYAGANQFDLPELQQHPIPGGIAVACQNMHQLLEAFDKALT